MENDFLDFLKCLAITAVFWFLTMFIFLYGGFYLGGIAAVWAFEGANLTVDEGFWLYESFRIIRLILVFAGCLVLPAAFLLSFKAVYSFALIASAVRFIFSIFKSNRKKPSVETETLRADEEEKELRKEFAIAFLPFMIVPPIMTLLFGSLAGFFTARSWFIVVAAYVATGLFCGVFSYFYFWLSIKLGIMSAFFRYQGDLE